ncbi:MAG TPA: hypothetical protein DCP07_01825 [Lachnospiraceae bacterium]|jgi:hypothetical protein|nr:hypothetical protein [Lachnospiraceae bacterium]
MNRFDNDRSKKKIVSSTLFSIIIFVVVIVVFLCGVSMLSNSSALDDRTVLEEALKKDIAHCYAVEGTYPESVEYMEEHYGLSYDKEHYIIDYEMIGANIYPSYMIVEIKKED